MWVRGLGLGTRAHHPPFATQEMMVSCKAGQGCGEMCVMGELMHVHADEQAICVHSMPGARMACAWYGMCMRTQTTPRALSAPGQPPPRPLSHHIQRIGMEPAPASRCAGGRSRDARPQPLDHRRRQPEQRVAVQMPVRGVTRESVTRLFLLTLERS